MRAPVGPPVVLVLVVLFLVLMVLPVVLAVIFVLVVLMMLPGLILVLAFVLLLPAPMPATPMPETVVPKAALISEGPRLLASEGGGALCLGVGSDSAKEGDKQQREHRSVRLNVIRLISATSRKERTTSERQGVQPPHSTAGKTRALQP